MDKIGFFCGKFYPIHLGHVYAMTHASTLVDELHVIVSYDENYEVNVLGKNSKLPHADYKKRVRWWKQITKHLPHVKVHAISETNDNSFESWSEGAEQIKKAVEKPITHVFSSESAYGAFFEKLYPEAEHVVIDEEREMYPVSATKLRTEGVYANWELLPEVVRRHYVKRVVIVGTESCGKSTLVQNLANLYNTNYVEEHGRTFYEEMDSYETFPEDYLKIAYRQKYFEDEGLKGSNKLLFIDTEANVTHRFMREYHIDDYKYSDDSDAIYHIAEAQRYDLWLFLEPDVDWVDDGTRTLGDDTKRLSGNELLKFHLNIHKANYISISGNYNERLHTAMTYINELIK